MRRHALAPEAISEAPLPPHKCAWLLRHERRAERDTAGEKGCEGEGWLVKRTAARDSDTGGGVEHGASADARACETAWRAAKSAL